MSLGNLHSFLPAHEDFLLLGNPFLSPANEESLSILYDVTCKYAAVDVATAKGISTELIICYQGMLCKWKTAVLAWFSVFRLQFEVSIDG